ncbi:MAG: aldo/keto reductase [Casimicrobiaceae bacterium]
MHYHVLPRTDLRVSKIALGTMTWGEQNTEHDACEQLGYAVAQGINFIDTAEMYPIPPRAETQGRTEALLARALAGHRREDLVIASKVAGPGRRDWIRDGRTDLTRANIAEACDTTLARLGIEHIDLYQIHWPQRNVPMFGTSEFDPAKEREGPAIHEQVEAMGALLKAGKIRHYGLSNETAWGVVAFQAAAQELGVPGPATVQNSCSLVSRSVEGDLAEALYREGMSLLAYSPLAAGMLTGKYCGGARPADARLVRFDNASTRFRQPLVLEAMEAYAALAARSGVTLVELAMGYVCSRWYLGAVIIGATTMAQLAEDIAAADVTLTADVQAEIAAIQARYPNPAA